MPHGVHLAAWRGTPHGPAALKKCGGSKNLGTGSAPVDSRFPKQASFHGPKAKREFSFYQPLNASRVTYMRALPVLLLLGVGTL